jgi:uncharacterized protein YbjT (DUF2867 family)
MAKTAVLVGASGLIGNRLLQLLLHDPYFTEVKIAVRKSLSLPHPKLQEFITDFYDTEVLEKIIAGSSAVFCTVGTTQSKVKGDKAAYRKVDYQIPVNMATLCNQHHIADFLMVSAIGANSKSNNFYLQLKGETENAIELFSSIGAIHFFQPSLLLGRRNEQRTGEKMGQYIMPVFSFLLAGPFKKYRAIAAEEVARAMLAVAKTNRLGVHRYRYSEIKELAAIAF